jgi:hypothetical protein
MEYISDNTLNIGSGISQQQLAFTQINQYNSKHNLPDFLAVTAVLLSYLNKYAYITVNCDLISVKIYSQLINLLHLTFPSLFRR